MALQYNRILGIPFLNTTRSRFINLIKSRIENNDKTFIVTANPEIVMHANENAFYRTNVLKATYIIADGIGIVQASRLAHRPLPERVSGFDVMTDLMKLSTKGHYTIYLLGAKEPILERTIQQLKAKLPEIKIVGSHHGYFSEQENEQVVREIQRKQPDLVFVALGCPLQENWIAANIHHFSKGIFMGVGGGFDVLSGIVKRAPDSWIRLNLEWFYRFIKQPTRWKRMLFIPKFGFLVLRKKWQRTL